MTIAEILTKPFADKNFSLADEIKFTLHSFSSLSVASIDAKLAEAAALIRARYAIRLPDALQHAAAVQAEATLFLTNDKWVKKSMRLKCWCFPTLFEAENKLFALPFTE